MVGGREGRPRGPQNVNPIYNLLPDILSALGADGGLADTSFQKIMSVLLSYISKKHVEPLANKLAQRLSNVAEVAAFPIGSLDRMLLPAPLVSSGGRYHQGS